MVAAAFHRHRQFVGAAEGRDEQRDQDGDQRADALGEFAVIQLGAAGFLGVHDLFGLVDQRRDKAQRNGHHHRELMHREVQFLQRAQQRFDRIGQHDGAGRVGQKAGARDERDDAGGHKHGVVDAFAVDAQHPELPQRFAFARDKEQVEHGREHDQRHDGLEAFEDQLERDLRNAVKQHEHGQRQRDAQRVGGDKQHDDVGDDADQLEARVAAVQHRMAGEMLADRNITKHGCPPFRWAGPCPGGGRSRP